MAELEELVKIEITKPLPPTGVAATTYKIEGTVKMFDAIGAFPWVYAEVKKKKWYLPEAIEETSYERGFPIPVTGNFTVEFTPDEGADYEVTVLATPAPLSLPVVGVFPITGKSAVMKVEIAKPTAADIRNISISVVGIAFPHSDIKNIAITVIGPLYPTSDIRNIAITVIGPLYPTSDIRNIAFTVIGPAYPPTDLRNITIRVLGIEYKGSIIKKELEYNESRGLIPVSAVPKNKRGLFHVVARNDMTTSQAIGIYWFIHDPDAMIVEEYTDWKWGTLGPGQTHEFIGGRFTFSKIGRYGTWVDLLMGSQSNPVVIYSARYIGTLATII